MNFLAHAFLSDGQAKVLTGNMISDYIKGKKQYDLPAPVQAGVQLHRFIDAYTDTHPCTKEISKIFAPHYRLYAGPITDIVYDYFVANDSANFTTLNSLQTFAEETYNLLEDNQQFFGEKFSLLFPHMKAGNWLYHYSTEQGIYQSMHGLQRRSKYITSIDAAFHLFAQNKTRIKIQYDIFFPELKLAAAHKLQQLLQSPNLSLKA